MLIKRVLLYTRVHTSPSQLVKKQARPPSHISGELLHTVMLESSDNGSTVSYVYGGTKGDNMWTDNCILVMQASAQHHWSSSIIHRFNHSIMVPRLLLPTHSFPSSLTAMFKCT